jgi:hypothetical protein
MVRIDGWGIVFMGILGVEMMGFWEMDRFDDDDDGFFIG